VGGGVCVAAGVDAGGLEGDGAWATVWDPA
jgi:hypothetical protein